jgi:hypothetical protein
MQRSHTYIVLGFGLALSILFTSGKPERAKVVHPEKGIPSSSPGGLKARPLLRADPLPVVPERTILSHDTGGASSLEGMDEGLSLLSGWVVHPDGSLVAGARVVSDDCPITVEVVDGFFQTDLFGSGCRIQARRKDGAFWTRSEWLEVSLAQGQELEVDLVLPAERTGGLGLRLWEHDEGFELLEAFSYADASGRLIQLWPGDIVTAMEGLPATTMRFVEFMEASTGPEGTEVSLQILQDSDGGWIEAEHVLVRELQAQGQRVEVGGTMTRLEALWVFEDPEIDPELWEELIAILEKQGRISD